MSVSLHIGRMDRNKQEECHWSLQTEVDLWPQPRVASLVWKNEHVTKENQGKAVFNIFRSWRDSERSTVRGLQCTHVCCLLWCGWPFRDHIALQDSDKTSWEVTKCPCGRNNTHIHRGKTHTGATSCPSSIAWLRSLVRFPFLQGVFEVKNGSRARGTVELALDTWCLVTMLRCYAERYWPSLSLSRCWQTCIKGFLK